MTAPRPKHRLLTVAAGTLLIGFTLVALALWHPFAAQPSPPQWPGRSGPAEEAASPAGRRAPIELSVARLESRPTDNWLNPHRRPDPLPAGSLRSAPPVAERIERDPSVADPPAIPVYPLPPVEPVYPPAVRRDDSELHPEMVEEWTPPESVAGPQLDQPHWPRADSLVQLLQPLRSQTRTTAWADGVLTTLRELERHPLKTADDRVPAAIARLLDYASQAKLQATSIQELRLRADLLRAAYALERRAYIWQDVAKILHPDAIVVSLRSVSPAEVDDLLGRIRSTLREHPQGATWAQYLRLDDIDASLNQNTAADAPTRSRLALDILGRMHSYLLSQAQADYLAQPPFSDLEQVLRLWVTEPIDYPQLLRDIEQYEAYRGSAEARRIAIAYQTARWSTQPNTLQLGMHLGDYYRNANARVAIAAELINELLPDPPPLEEDVDDEIAGARVMGRSRASGRLRIFLIPDRRHWRLGLESAGTVNAETSAERGPARFFHNSNTQYRAHKVLQVDQRGIRLWNAVADADDDTELTGFETDFDAVPLLGVIARSLALQQYDRDSDEARWQLRRRVTERIESRFDAEIEKNLRELKNQFVTRFHQPMRRLKLNPTPIELETTDTRLITRYRLAGDLQLAGHTPRPQAPGDSLLSTQIHESAINNILEQLALDGKQIELRQLYTQIGELFNGQPPEIPEDMPAGVMLTFADQDAVRVHFGRDEITVSLALHELAYEKRSWRDFVVRAAYRPHLERLDPTFERVNYVRLKGRRLNLKDQVVLRGIFSAVFTRNPAVHVLGDKLKQDSRFAPLAVSQYVVRGGWIGVALSRRERGQRPKSVARSPEELDLR